MVMFTCNRCSTGLKKSQVENHAFRCGGLSKIDLTCHDCLKDFRGKEFESHTSCVTEEVRYGGKNVVVKEVGKKQNLWCEVVQNVLNNNQGLDADVLKFLKSAVHYQNIPRKKKPFMNWANNVMKWASPDLTNRVFDILEAQFAQSKSEQPKPQNGSTKPDHSEAVSQNSDVSGGSSKKKKRRSETDGVENCDAELSNENGDVREKKKKKSSNGSISEDAMEPVGDEIAPEKLSKKERKLLKKKAKFDAEVAAIESARGVEDDTEEAVEEEKPKKTKKRKNKPEEAEKEDDRAKKRKVDAEEPPVEDPQTTTTKFDWFDAILTVLRKSKTDEVSVKKLTKRVINEYVSLHGDEGIHDKLHAKMNKKLRNCPGIRVLKDKVKLVDDDR